MITYRVIVLGSIIRIPCNDLQMTEINKYKLETCTDVKSHQIQELDMFVVKFKFEIPKILFRLRLTAPPPLLPLHCHSNGD